jgi:sirohydrochlorin ferrochelatase
VSRPVVLAAHGSADAHGLAVLERLRAGVGDALVDHEVVLGFVDVVEPHVRRLLVDRPDAVVVPLFVTAGYHVRVDLPTVLAEVAPGALLSPHLGGLEGFVDVLAARATAGDGAGRAGGARSAALVVAGSSDDRARAEADDLGRAVGIRAGLGSLPVAHLSGPGRPLETLDPVPDLLVSTLLAPGHFQGRLRAWAEAQGIAATEAVGDDPGLVAAVVAEVRRVTSAPAGA